MPLRWVLMIKFCIGMDLKIDWIFNFPQIFYWNADVPRYASPINFFKRKKRKKESQSSKWKVSKKQVFFKKYYPMRRWKLRASCLRKMFFWNCMGGDFFKNPQGLNLLFWIPATYLCSLFFIFYFVTDCRLSKMVLGKGIKFWGRKKWKPILYLCFFWTEIWYSFFSWFCVCFKCH